MKENEVSIDLHTIIISGAVALFVVAVSLAIFVQEFSTKKHPGVCAKYHWEDEGSGPYQAAHCFDPATREMYFPKELTP